MIRPLELLQGLGACPAVPFHESRPAGFVEDALRRAGVESRRDEFGNIIAHVPAAPGSVRAPIAFVAHLDHPGFEIVEVEDGSAVARALGGIPAAALVKPTPVFAILPDGGRLRGVTERHASLADPNDRAADRLTRIRFGANADLAALPPPPVLAAFDLDDFRLDGGEILMRAADDLAGCAAILAVLERVSDDAPSADVYGVFTRAEETGLFGARLMAEAATLPRDAVIVSVESSAVIPGVAQGDGPVIRVGDALTTFDAEAERTLTAAAAALRRRDPGFRAQRRLMSGGVCEATAFALAGYSVTGLAFPLLNYHNAATAIAETPALRARETVGRARETVGRPPAPSPPDGGVVEESIRVSDFLGGVELLNAAAMLSPEDIDTPQRLGKTPDSARRRLRQTS